MAGGGDIYSGTITCVVNSCVSNGDGTYTVNADFSFACAAFTGAKFPYLIISSTSGGSVSFAGNKYENDPLNYTFTIAAVPGDTLTITSGSWQDPSESGAQALLASNVGIYTIPDSPTPTPTTGSSIFGGFWGAAWGGGAWGGIVLQSTQTKKTNINGQTRIEQTASTAINGQARIENTAQTDISGQARIAYNVQTNIDGRVRIVGGNGTVINGQVDILVTTNKTIDGRVRIGHTNAKTINGRVHIMRTEQTNIDGIVDIENTATTSLNGVVNIYKVNHTDIDGVVRVESTETTEINGRVRVITTVPEKLPQTWEYDDPEKLPETWEYENPEKQPQSWEDSAPKVASEWDDSSANDKLPQDWEYDDPEKEPETWEYEQYEIKSIPPVYKGANYGGFGTLYGVAYASSIERPLERQTIISGVVNIT